MIAEGPSPSFDGFPAGFEQDELDGVIPEGYMTINELTEGAGIGPGSLARLAAEHGIAPQIFPTAGQRLVQMLSAEDAAILQRAALATDDADPQ